MQIEIVPPISPQLGCRFLAYKTHFGCLDTKLGTGVETKHIKIKVTLCS
jgi:hypothetical protein